MSRGVKILIGALALLGVLTLVGSVTMLVAGYHATASISRVP
jgi:hypothetical protein